MTLKPTSLNWQNSERKKIKRRVDPAKYDEIKRLASENEETMDTVSKLWGAVIQYSTYSGELGAVEKDLERRIEGEGVPVPFRASPTFVSFSEKNKILRAPVPESCNDGLSQEVYITLPAKVAESHNEAARESGYRKSEWLDIATSRFLTSPFSSRAERIQAKQAYLAKVKNEESEHELRVGVEELVGKWVDAVSGADEVTWDTIDFAEWSIDDQDLTLEPEKDEVQELPTGKKRRVAMTAILRGQASELGKLSEEGVREWVERFNSADYSSQAGLRNLADDVLEQLRSEGLVEDEDELTIDECLDVIANHSAKDRVEAKAGRTYQHLSSSKIKRDLTEEQIRRIAQELREG